MGKGGSIQEALHRYTYVWYAFSMANRVMPGNWYALRFQVLQRDGFTCHYCGQAAPSVTLEVDHVIPVVEGGTDALDNLVTVCRACNRGKEGLRVRMRVVIFPQRARVPIGPRPTSMLTRFKQWLPSHQDMTTREMAIEFQTTEPTIRGMKRKYRLEKES